jgi:phage terminase large subunit
MPNFTFPEKFDPLLPNDAGEWPHYTFVFIPGGRGGARSRSATSYVLARMRERPMRWLCAREIQNSIRDSMHLSFRDEIDRQDMGVTGTGEFDAVETEIRNKNGGLIIFRGLLRNLDSLKSIEGLNGFVIDEAQSISQASLDKLIPTVLRNKGSVCIFLFNPENETDPVNRLMEMRRGKANTLIIEMSLDDNPWATEEMFEERELAYQTDPDRAAWIWGGKFLKNSDAQVFAKKYRVESFEPKPEWDGPYFGMDFGFSQDPCFAVEVYLGEGNLWIRRQARSKDGHPLDIDKYPELLNTLPGCVDRVLRCDCSRPESISYLSRHGYPRAVGVKKWAGSVEDGVSWIRSHGAIVIHPDCPDMAEEARLYSYKVDPRSGDILPDIVDKNNHGWDAVRYACEPMISAKPRAGWSL